MSKDIVATILNYGINLQVRNGVYKAICPFHDEKTPSFVVYPETQSWCCYGACGRGGDIIEFVRLLKGLTYKEALKELNLENEVYSLKNLKNKLTEKKYVNTEIILLNYYLRGNKLLYKLNLSVSKQAKFLDILLQKKDLRRLKKFCIHLGGL